LSPLVGCLKVLQSDERGAAHARAATAMMFIGGYLPPHPAKTYSCHARTHPTTHTLTKYTSPPPPAHHHTHAKKIAGAQGYPHGGGAPRPRQPQHSQAAVGEHAPHQGGGAVHGHAPRARRAAPPPAVGRRRQRGRAGTSHRVGTFHRAVFHAALTLFHTLCIPYKLNFTPLSRSFTPCSYRTS
jgi:hypothetical protein